MRKMCELDNSAGQSVKGYHLSSTVQTKIPVFLEIIFSLIQCMVTAIQADPEVAFRKLPSREFFMFYFIIYI